MSSHNESLSNVHSSVPTANKTGWKKILAFIGPPTWLALVIWTRAIGQPILQGEVLLVTG